MFSKFALSLTPDPEGNAASNSLMPYSRLLFVGLTCALIAGIAAATYLVNDHDNQIHRQLAERFFLGGDGDIYTYELDGQTRTGYYLPHSGPFIAVFTYLGPRYSAFWDLAVILLLITSTSQRWSELGTRSLVIFTPLVLFATAAANISGTMTGLGLLLLLTQRRGVPRGIAWAMLLIRPQETVFVLLVDGLLSLWQRDWRALATIAVFIVLPPIFYGVGIYWRWYTLVTGFLPGRDDYLDYLNIHGPVAAAALLGVLILLRSFKFQQGRLTLRSLDDIPVSELYWLLIMMIFIFGEYTRLYGVWSVFLLLRHSSPREAVLIIGLSLLIGVFWLTEWDFDRFGNGLAITMVMIATFAGRSLPPNQGRSVSEYLSRRPQPTA